MSDSGDERLVGDVRYSLNCGMDVEPKRNNCSIERKYHENHSAILVCLYSITADFSQLTRMYQNIIKVHYLKGCVMIRIAIK